MAKAKKFKPGPNQRGWFKMLETTRRKQCQGALHREGVGYCCLGIAELSLGRKPKDLDFRWALDSKAVKALGLRDKYGLALGDLHHCARLNDDDRLTFKQIAAHLRKHAAAYFKRSA